MIAFVPTTKKWYNYFVSVDDANQASDPAPSSVQHEVRLKVPLAVGLEMSSPKPNAVHLKL